MNPSKTIPFRAPSLLLGLVAILAAGAPAVSAQSVVSTSFGAGADVNIRGGSNTTENSGSTTSVQAAAPGTNVRHIYLKFDLTGAAPILSDDPVAAQLDVYNAFNGAVGEQTLRVYGLNDSANLDGWVEGTINAENAPAIVTPNTLALNFEILTDLGTFVSDQKTGTTGAGLQNSFSSVALLDFLKSDTDNLVTLIIVQESFAEGASGNFGIRTKEFVPERFAPTLTIIPEPTTYGLVVGVLALGFLAVRRRKAV